MKNVFVIATVAISLCEGASAAAPPRVSARTQPVVIILSNFAFTPQNVRLRHGLVYQLHLVNRGSGAHNLAAPEFFAAAQISPADAGIVSGGKVELGKGESRRLQLIPAAGTYRVTCTHFLHASFGMTGSIIVD